MDPDGGSAKAGQPAQSRGRQQGARGPRGADPGSRTGAGGAADFYFTGETEAPTPGRASRWEEGVQGPSDDLVQVLLIWRQESSKGAGEEREERAGKRLPPLLPAPEPPASRAQSPCSVRGPSQPGSCWQSAGQRRSTRRLLAKEQPPPPPPPLGLEGPGGAWGAAWCRQVSGGWPARAPRRPAVSDETAQGDWAGSRVPTRVQGAGRAPPADCGPHRAPPGPRPT